MDQASSVIEFPTPPFANTTHPLVKQVTDALVSLGHLARQIEKWPIDDEPKLRMLDAIKSAALHACQLQLAAVTEIADAEKFRADVTRVMEALSPPSASRS
jgi:hypothetical protein